MSYRLWVLLSLALLGCATARPASPALAKPSAVELASTRPVLSAPSVEEITRLAVFLCKYEQLPVPVLSRLPQGTRPADYMRSEDASFLQQVPSLAFATPLDRPGLHAELARYGQCEVAKMSPLGSRVEVILRRTRPPWGKGRLPPELMEGLPGPERTRQIVEEWSQRDPTPVAYLHRVLFVRTSEGWRADYQLPERLAAERMSSPAAQSVPEAAQQEDGEELVVSFGAGMTRPERISGPLPQYTWEALAHSVEGLMIVKCVITTEGLIQRCRVLRPLPFMVEATLYALYQTRYKPVTFQGRVIQVDYTFNIKLSLPRSWPRAPGGSNLIRVPEARREGGE